jgi:hypothetical protein
MAPVSNVQPPIDERPADSTLKNPSSGTVAWITREKHIRQCIPFPRMMDKVCI